MKPFRLLSVLFSMVAFVPAAYASSNSAEATIDWSQANYSFIVGSGTIDFSTFTSGANAYAYLYDGSATNLASTANPLSVGGLSGGADSTLSAYANASYAGYDGHQDYVSAYFYFGGTITLEAGAVVTFEVPYSLSAVAGNSGPNEYATATASWHLSEYTNWNRNYSGSASVSASDGQSLQTDADKLYLTFANHSGASQSYWLNAQASASASTALAPVPEPETYAMLMAGLGLVGVMARRRRQPAA